MDCDEDVAGRDANIPARKRGISGVELINIAAIKYI